MLFERKGGRIKIDNVEEQGMSLVKRSEASKKVESGVSRLDRGLQREIEGEGEEEGA